MKYTLLDRIRRIKGKAVSKMGRLVKKEIDMYNNSMISK